jgi:hypothetical protein
MIMMRRIKLIKESLTGMMRRKTKRNRIRIQNEKTWGRRRTKV